MFLETLAKHIITKEGDRLADCCFVLPNRRSGLFFKRFLLKYSNGTKWAPSIVTINELMQELSGIETADPLDLLFACFDVYTQHADYPEPFDTFYPWGEMMLNDFDTLDKYLVDSESVFRNIHELKEIDNLFGDLDEEHIAFIRKFWKSFHQGEMTDEKEIFLSAWNMLPIIYSDLKKNLLKQGVGYEGLIYRDVAEKSVQELSEKLKSEYYYFVGFNALSASEKKLFSVLQKKNIASFYWDYDNLYVRDETMEAGRFLRDNIINFPPPEDLEIFDNMHHDRNVRIFDLPSDVLQAKTVHQLLKETDHSIKEANDTAIIACNENLLMPVLFSLPEDIDLVNITMGYPFSNTPLNSFIESVLKLQRNVRRNKEGKLRFYYKDVLSVLNHHYFKLVSDEDISVLVKKIISGNHVYIEPGFFENGLADIIVKKVDTAAELCIYLEEIFRTILKRLLLEEDNNKNRELEREYLLVMLNRLNKLSEITADRKELEIETFIRFFRRIISNLRIPFSGEPLAGLQIMGILETRLLDFENVIMLSVNEDIMPRSSAGHSFIPYSLRYAYGLPVREDMDAIYAYYFYRLIQRAKRVDLLFKSATEGVDTGEMSRYLYQMKYDFNATIIRPVLPVTASEKTVVEITKTPEILNILNKYIEGNKEGKYLSPSALNSYIECPLKFYFQRIEGVKEQDELKEELDAIGFGNILHKTIYRLYDSIKQDNKLIEKADFLQLMKGDVLDDILLDEFKNEYFKFGKKRKLEGRNLIVLAILKKYLQKIIKNDAAIAPIELLDLEQSYYFEKDIGVKNESLTIRLGGQIDRIDRLSDGIVRIIDYKTGKAETAFESIDSLFNHDYKGRSKEAFQAFLYAAMYLNKYPDQLVQPGLYIVKQFFGDNYSSGFKMGTQRKKIPISSFNEYLDEFNGYLIKLLEELFNADISFMQTNVTDRCKYCDFKEICQRG